MAIEILKKTWLEKGNTISLAPEKGVKSPNQK
jgi:hypothetical protein